MKTKRLSISALQLLNLTMKKLIVLCVIALAGCATTETRFVKVSGRWYRLTKHDASEQTLAQTRQTAAEMQAVSARVVFEPMSKGKAN